MRTYFLGIILIAASTMSFVAAAQPQLAGKQAADTAAEFRADALSVESLIQRSYAYLERLPRGRFELTTRLRSEAEAVTDQRSLLRFSERALLLLADHHAITGSSFSNSWAVVPSYSDLWIEPSNGVYAITSVRGASPAEAAGIRAGDTLLAIDGLPVAEAVRAFWADLGAQGGGERDGFAARVLGAGRRDRPRMLMIRDGKGRERTHQLPNLYTVQSPGHVPVHSQDEGRSLLIKINDALGDGATVAAFDEAMRQAKPGQRVIIDLTNTPSGGNTSVARGIMGWFVDRASAYQMHRLPAEERETRIPRQWIEQVLPRPGMLHRGPVEVRVSRWTGSMGEGLAIGFHALRARVAGSRMAGLLGAIYDHRLPNSGLILKLPTERLMTVTGQPRESFVPPYRISR